MYIRLGDYFRVFTLQNSQYALPDECYSHTESYYNIIEMVQYLHYKSGANPRGGGFWGSGPPNFIKREKNGTRLLAKNAAF